MYSFKVDKIPFTKMVLSYFSKGRGIKKHAIVGMVDREGSSKISPSIMLILFILRFITLCNKIFIKPSNTRFKIFYYLI